MVGRAVATALRGEGHTVHRLARPGKQPESGDVHWDPVAGTLDRAAGEGADALVNLAGASIAEGRWSDDRKNVLRSSRVDATRHLVNELAKLASPPCVMVSASASGYYGNRGDEVLTEESAPGSDFLAELTRAWEAEAGRAEEIGIRTAILRFGVILSPGGGALARMLPAFRLGLGGRLGSGKQWMSWLSLPEAVSLIRNAIENSSLRGAMNASAPNPLTNAEFTTILGRVLRRPAVFPVPEFGLRLLFGEMADTVLLSSQRMLPKRLQGISYTFQHPELEQALRAVLSRPG
jgi:uncharacterized protein (TIGR01777 family)